MLRRDAHLPLRADGVLGVERHRANLQDLVVARHEAAEFQIDHKELHVTPHTAAIARARLPTSASTLSLLLLVSYGARPGASAFSQLLGHRGDERGSARWNCANRAS